MDGGRSSAGATPGLAQLAELAAAETPILGAQGLTAVDGSEDEPRRVVGIRQEGGQYKVTGNSDFSPWLGQHGSVEERGKYKSVVLYGMLRVGNGAVTQRHFFGHGDTIVFRRGEMQARGLCLGFAEPNGKAYAIIVRSLDEQKTQLMDRKNYIALDEKEPPVNSDETKQWLFAFLQNGTQKRGEKLEGGVSGLTAPLQDTRDLKLPRPCHEPRERSVRSWCRATLGSTATRG
jgi:hypothetical protein